MSELFLAGVANTRIFKGNDLFATAKTLIDSSISIGVSAEDIRAGKGSKLLGKYFHSSTFDLKMTDAMFKLEYIAANVGSDLKMGGDIFTEFECKGSDIPTRISEAKPMKSGDSIYVYIKKVSEQIWKTYKKEDIEIENPFESEENYCVQILINNENSRKLTVYANFTPDTLSVYLDADLYAGDVNGLNGNKTKIGTLTIKIPRFLLSGAQEISMSMTGAAQIPLEGSALANSADGCQAEGNYAEIVEINTDFNWKDYVVKIIVDGGIDALRASEGDVSKINVYALMGGFYAPKKLDSNDFNLFTSVTTKNLDTENQSYIIQEDSILLQHKENTSWSYGEIKIIATTSAMSNSIYKSLYFSSSRNNSLVQISEIEMGICKTKDDFILSSSFSEDINKYIVYDLKNIRTIYTCQNATIKNNNKETLEFIKGVQFDEENKGTFYNSIIDNRDIFLINETIPYLFNKTQFTDDLSISANYIADYTFIENNFYFINFTDIITTMGSSVFENCNELKIIRVKNQNKNSIENSPWGADPIMILWGLPDTIQFVNYDNSTQTLIIEGDGSNNSILSKDIIEDIEINAVIKQIVLKNIISIENEVFVNYFDLNSVYIPNSTLNIADYVFTDCNNLTTISVDISNPKYSSNDGVLFNKDKTELIKCPSKKIGIYSIPEGVLRIKTIAFEHCIDLTEINISKTVKTIEDYAFVECSDLGSINVDNNNQWYSSVEGVLFDKNRTKLICCPCVKSGEYSIPNSIKEIKKGAFYGCSDLTEINIPNGVLIIGLGAFYNCSSLTSIFIPSSVKQIQGNIFVGCSELMEINVDEENENYSSENGILFNKDKTELIGYPSGVSDSYSIPNTVLKMKTSSFEDCDNINELIIPNALEVIENCSIIGGDDFESIIVNGTNENYSDENGILFNKDKTELIYYPCGKTGDYIVPEGVIKIKNPAFVDCENLTSVEIPESVTTIEPYVFYNSDNLLNIIIHKATGEIEGSPWGASPETIITWTE